MRWFVVGGALVAIATAVACGGSEDTGAPAAKGGAGTSGGGGAAGSIGGDASGGSPATTGGTAGEGSDGATGGGGASGGAVGSGGVAGDGGAPGGAGGGGAGASAGGSGGQPPTSCGSDNDCTPFGLLCDQAAGQCVRCLDDIHCGTNEACVAGQCEPYVSCTSSLDCVNAPDGKTICDTSPGRCVQCLTASDCSMAGDECIDDVCVCGDLQNDPDNCGACGRQCSEGCENGDCRPEFRECLLNYQDYADCNAYCQTIGLGCAETCGGAGFLSAGMGAWGSCNDGSGMADTTCDRPLNGQRQCCCKEVP